ncbi:MAG: hypothetical protein CVU84_08220 [Firmicutes bacterium HGW-Firmicutes-1]|jgi:hypothetical protein|nr:MAG: hypothetical protein CVU84_08220 [Firmicutes bacterium HGW-Firmicutes-1]
MKGKGLFCIRNVIISFFVFMAMYYLISFSPIGLAKLTEITNGNSILDMEMGGYTVDQAYEILTALGEEGRGFEMKYIIPIDFPFPLAYGIFYFMLLSTLAKGIFSKMKKPWLIGLIGFGATIFDWLENAMIIQLLNNYPQQLQDVAKLANIFTRLKSTFITISMFLIVIGFVVFMVKRFLPKSNT